MIRIGCRYVRPLPRLSADEERLQRLLLDGQRESDPKHLGWICVAGIVIGLVLSFLNPGHWWL